MKSFRLVVMGISCLLALSPVVQAASATWTKTATGTSEYWTNSLNWSASPYPGSGSSESALLNTAVAGSYTNILNSTLPFTLSSLNIANSGGGQAWLVVTNATLTDTSLTLGTGGRLQIDSGGLVTGITTFTWSGTSGTIYLNNGGQLITSASLLPADVNGTTGTVTSLGAPGQGGSWSNSSTFFVGGNNSYVSLSFNNVTFTNTGNINISGNPTSHDNSLTVSNGAVFYTPYFLSVGSGAAGNSNNVFRAGGLGAASVLTVNSGIVLGFDGGQGNQIIVTNANLTVGLLGLAGGSMLRIDGGVVTNNGTFGWTGTNGTVAINNNGTFVSTTPSTFTGAGFTGMVTSASAVGGTWDGKAGVIAFGFNSASTNNQLVIGGAVTMTNVSTLYIGFGNGTTKQAIGNSLVLSNGASLFLNSLAAVNLGYSVGDNSNSFVIGGLGLKSRFVNSADIYVGRFGSDNSLTTSNANLVTGNLNVGYVGTNNTATILSNASWTIVGNMSIGNFAGVNSRVLIDGGVVSNTVGGIVLGVTADSYGNSLTVSNGGQFIGFPGGVVIGFAASNNTFNVGGFGASSLVSNNAITVGNTGAGYNTLTVTNATLRSSTTIIGSGSSNNTAKVQAGGTWNLLGNLTVGSGAATGNLMWVQSGGVLDVGANTISTGTGAGNAITNSGGVYQFSTATPTISAGAGAGSIAINSGTISFRDLGATVVNLTNNWKGSQLTTIAWSGNNALRIDNSTATNTVAGGYTFSTGLGATNYYRLEMINGTTKLGGNGITIAGAASFWASNTTATISGPVTNLAGGVVRIDNANVTWSSAVVNKGAWITDPSTNTYLSDFTVTSSGSISMSAGDTFIFKSNFVNQSTQSNTYNTLAGKFLFSGVGLTQQFATAGKDLGPGWTNQSPLNITNQLPGPIWGEGVMSNNFALGTLEIANSSTVEVTDAFSALLGNNDSQRAALYVQDLVLGANSFLIIDTNVSLYFYSTNNWGVGAGYVLVGDAELHQLIPEPSILFLLMGGISLLWWRLQRRG